MTLGIDTANARPIIPWVVEQHAEEAAILYEIRTRLAAERGATLRDLARFDTRVEAHLDGLRLAGVFARPFCDAALATPSRGAMFTAAVRAIEESDSERLRSLHAAAANDPSLDAGLEGAFGWVEAASLRGRVASMLVSDDHDDRRLGISACVQHRVAQPQHVARWLRDGHPVARSRGLRAAGELGAIDLISEVRRQQKDPDETIRLTAAWAGALLGTGADAVEILLGDVVEQREEYVTLALQAASLEVAHGALQRLAKDGGRLRALTQASGVTGCPRYVPWLVERMDDPLVAPLAGEAFSLITGVDLSVERLERERPAEGQAGPPNDDPDDPRVTSDPADDLPWPDSDLVRAWWLVHGSRFRPDLRYFLGEPVTREHCIHVLKTGYQRQRTLAANYLCLLNPGTPLFNTSAPAWRQQRLLAQM